jgi:hypothetical protein
MVRTERLLRIVVIRIIGMGLSIKYIVHVWQ